jgi:GNAT superfamily N-acetyltransferase
MLTDFRRLAGLIDPRVLSEAVSDLSGVTFKKGRSNLVGYVRHTFNLHAKKGGGLSDFEKGYSYDEKSIKPDQFARLEIEREGLATDNVPGLADALRAVKTKSTPKKGDDWAMLNSVRGAVVAQAFRGRGYGLALLLKALEFSTESGFWMATDFTGTDTADALRTWAGLKKYAAEFFEGEHSINPDSYGAIAGKWDAALLARGSFPFVAAYGLNAKGVKALKDMR